MSTSPLSGKYPIIFKNADIFFFYLKLTFMNVKFCKGQKTKTKTTSLRCSTESDIICIMLANILPCGYSSVSV